MEPLIILTLALIWTGALILENRALRKRLDSDGS